MKDLIYFLGMPRSGKTTRAKEAANALQYELVSTDNIYYDIAVSLGLDDKKIVDFPHPKYWEQEQKIDKLKMEFYSKKLQPLLGKDIIIEGYALTNKQDRQMIETILMRQALSFFIPLSFEDWVWRIGQKVSAYTAQEYNYLSLRMDIPKDAWTINQNISLNFPETNYQKEDISIAKFNALHMDSCNRESVLDLGGNSGMISCGFKDRGASRVTVVDYNWRDLRIARARGLETILFDLNYIQDFTQHADIVVCMSAIHYIADKDKFIQRCSELTNKVFILETPVILEEGYKVIYGQPAGTSKPTKAYIEKLLSNYFPKVETVGESPSYDGSYRLVYKCYKP